MKVGIMQPYFLPYIGYWQLIYAVDKFVLLDDVNYIKRGYINRNTILLDQKPYKFTIPVQKASQNKLILDTKLSFSPEKKAKFLQTICNAYRKAPFFSEVIPLIKEIIDYSEDDLTNYILNSIRIILDYLDVKTSIYISSMLSKKQGLRAEERIIEICKVMGADMYINSCGGRELYVCEHFEKEKIELYFLDVRINKIWYDQGIKEFKKNLSILDILMFNHRIKVRQLLNEYDLNR